MPAWGPAPTAGRPGKREHGSASSEDDSGGEGNEDLASQDSRGSWPTSVRLSPEPRRTSDEPVSPPPHLGLDSPPEQRTAVAAAVPGGAATAGLPADGRPPTTVVPPELSTLYSVSVPTSLRTSHPVAPAPPPPQDSSRLASPRSPAATREPAALPTLGSAGRLPGAASPDASPPMGQPTGQVGAASAAGGAQRSRTPTPVPPLDLSVLHAPREDDARAGGDAAQPPAAQRPREPAAGDLATARDLESVPEPPWGGSAPGARMWGVPRKGAEAAAAGEEAAAGAAGAAQPQGPASEWLVWLVWLAWLPWLPWLGDAVMWDGGEGGEVKQAQALTCQHSRKVSGLPSYMAAALQHEVGAEHCHAMAP